MDPMDSRENAIFRKFDTKPAHSIHLLVKLFDDMRYYNVILLTTKK